MTKINFPGLGLNFNISKIAFTILGINVYYYAIIIVFAITLSIFLLKKQDGRFGIKYKDILDLIIYLIPISLIGARIYYIVFNFQYYFQHPNQIINLRNGGLAIYGAIISGILVVYLYCKKRRLNFLDLLDVIIPYVSLSQSMGRLGNFVNAEAYGVQTNLPWRMGIGQNGEYVEVHPTFLYELVATFLIYFILIYIRDKRIAKGQVVYVYFILYSFIRFFIEGLRTDSLLIFNFRVSQIVSIILFVVFCWILTYNIIKMRKKNDTIKKQRKLSYENR